MTQHNTASTHPWHSTAAAEQELTTAVGQLLQAENDARPKAVGSLLSPRFIAITRSDGRELGREEFLQSVGVNGAGTDSRRLEAPPQILAAKTLGAARFVVEVAGPATQILRFRNTLLFEHLGDGWRCLSWQVTRLAEP